VQSLSGSRDAALGQQRVEGDEQIEIETREQGVIGHDDVILRVRIPDATVSTQSM
jgi:hypothetical protein